MHNYIQFCGSFMPILETRIVAMLRCKQSGVTGVGWVRISLPKICIYGNTSRLTTLKRGGEMKRTGSSMPMLVPF